MHKDLKGIIAYPITPIGENDTLDIGALRLSIGRLIDSGVHAIAPLGSTGEAAYLSDREWEEVAEAAVRFVAGRVPVVVGVSDLTTRNAVRRARFAENVGADAVMVLPVSYWKLSEQEIFDHYKSIAESVDLPIMLYNNPATSGVDMKPPLIARIVSEIDNVTMVKESSGDIQRMHQLVQLSDGAIPFYNGSNPLALEAFAAGAVGWCTAAPNLIPRLNIDLYEASRCGDLLLARELFFKQLPLLDFILAGGLPTTIKAGLRLAGLDVGRPRRPLSVLSKEKTETLKTLLRQLGQDEGHKRAAE